MVLFMKVKIYKMRKVPFIKKAISKEIAFKKNFLQLHVTKNFQHTLRRLLFCIYPIS